MSTPNSKSIDTVAPRKGAASAFIAVEALSKSFRSPTRMPRECEEILQNLSLTWNAGEFCTIFGPNGCGKSTFLNILAGLLEPDRGTVSIDGDKPRPGRAVYVFQNFKDSLFPWRTVAGNLMFPLECMGSDLRERRRQLEHFLESFGVPLPLEARVYELSTGQQQLVAVARALTTQPRLLLMDEPFSALDFRLRRTMQDHLLRYWRDTGATILLTSHELDEAIYLGERLLVFPPAPVRTVEDVPITLGASRSREVVFSEEFVSIRSQVLRFVEDKRHST